MRTVKRKYHYFYKITNNLNDHYYYGIHSTDNLDDGYMGSGTILRYAYEKYDTYWITKDEINKKIKKEELEIFEQQGWKRGRNLKSIN